MPVPAGDTQIPVICDSSIQGTINLDLKRSNGTAISAVKLTGYGTGTDLQIAYIDGGGTIAYTTSANPGRSKLCVSVWYNDGSNELGTETLTPEDVYTVPDNAIQIGLYYGS